ncbi:MAG: SprB repeat-containing protein, partial [Bacteroidota bacterium]
MTKNLLTSKLLFGGYTLFFSLLCFSAAAQLEVTVIGEDVRCFGLASGTATATVSNATLPVTYAWSNGGTTAIITNLNAGTYGVTVTDADGATASGSVTLSQPTAVTATITDPDQCEGPYIIAAEPEGGVIPYTYNWSTGADTRGITVPVGSYCVTVVDANLCGYVACTTIEENPPSVTLVGVDAQCNDADDGSITANPSGGTPPYTYAWSNGESSQAIDNLAPGGYQVTLTDARGCMATASTSISEPPAITGNIFGDASVCPGVADAFIRIAPTGGTPPYSYVWSPGGFTGQGVGPLPAGMYSVTVTDANECTIVRSFVILTSEDVEVEITGDELLCGAGTTGTLTASPVNGPVDQYTYEWSTGATSPIITNVSAGEYTVTATDANGCTGTATATVRTIDLSVTLSSTPTNCVDGMDGTATAVATGGDTPY